MPPSSRRRRCTYSRRSELSAARLKPIQRRQRDRARPKTIVAETTDGQHVETALALGPSVQEALTVAIAVRVSTVAIAVRVSTVEIAAKASTAVIAADHSIAGPAIAETIPAEIVTAHERSQRSVPPDWWVD